MLCPELSNCNYLLRQFTISIIELLTEKLREMKRKIYNIRPLHITHCYSILPGKITETEKIWNIKSKEFKFGKLQEYKLDS